MTVGPSSSGIWTAARVRGEDTPSKSNSLGDDDEEDDDEDEGGIIFSPCSPSPENLPSPGDLFGRQAGISVGAH
jgi:hypothetical protein